jgi:hypothetical protein
MNYSGKKNAGKGPVNELFPQKKRVRAGLNKFPFISAGILVCVSLLLQNKALFCKGHVA